MGGDCEHEAPEMQPMLAAGMVEAFPDITVGIKTAHYWTRYPFDDKHKPWTSVDRAVEAGELCHKPVMVDFWPRLPERPYPDLILEHLRPGDIHTHFFAQQFPVLDADRKVSDFLWAARERGIIFDLGHGAGSFWFRNAVPAIGQGFWPDSISTDLHTHSVLGPVFDMLTTMNKCLNLGIPLEEVVARSTVAPAREIGHPELGTLGVGSEADVAVFDLERGRFPFWDCGRAKLWGDQRLVCKYTLRAGQVVHNPDGWGYPEWEQAPAPYWVMPALQSPT
jgi:dihydroorotase